MRIKKHIYIKAIAFSEKEDAAQLQHLFTMQLEDNKTKIESVKIFSIIQDIKTNQDAIKSILLRLLKL
jgi:geranylgeranyl diphosphate synthase type II